MTGYKEVFIVRIYVVKAPKFVKKILSVFVKK